MMKIGFIIIIALSLFSLCACGNEDQEREVVPEVCSLIVSQESNKVRLGLDQTVAEIRSGNGSYTITVEDPSVVRASYYGNQDPRIVVHGLKMGKTKVFVSDDISGEKYEFEVRVTNKYLGFSIDKSNYVDFPVGSSLFLTANENKDFYLLAKGKVKQGTYELRETLHLYMNFEGENGEQIVHNFDFKNSLDTMLFIYLDIIFDLEWILSRSVGPAGPTYMILEETWKGENLEIYCNAILSKQIPDGLINVEYE